MVCCGGLWKVPWYAVEGFAAGGGAAMPRHVAKKGDNVPVETPGGKPRDRSKTEDAGPAQHCGKKTRGCRRRPEGQLFTELRAKDITALGDDPITAHPDRHTQNECPFHRPQLTLGNW